MSKLTLSGLVLFVAAAAAVAAEPKAATLQVGDAVEAFYVKDVTGPAAGTELCYRCRYGNRPVISIFTRKVTDQVASLTKEVDATVGRHADKDLAGFVVVLTTRNAANASALEKAIKAQGGASMIVELDLVSHESISKAFAQIRERVGDPDVVIYNAGYLEGRDLPPEKELLEHIPVEMFETAQHIASRGPFLVAKEVLPAMRERGAGTFLISNNASSLRGRKRMTGQSLYYPRVMMSTLAQVLTEEYSEYGVHVANVVIDGLIDSPGTRALPRAQQHPDVVMNPVKIAEAFYYLHTQDKSCWTHELQLTPFATKPSF